MILWPIVLFTKEKKSIWYPGNLKFYTFWLKSQTGLFQKGISIIQYGGQLIAVIISLIRQWNMWYG
ncbi:hypothetical protein ADH76_04470 [Enterocloster clostridioformis]|nr:hypothetical protein A4V08_00130 [Lachnoclostridium sp. YL32]OXE70639.1 hypothetical protein ADH76_04470 [Enterocloster clostridioformis]